MRGGHTAAEACRLTGATAQDLADFAAEGLLVPRRRLWPPWRREAYYSDDQVRVVRFLLELRARGRAG